MAARAFNRLEEGIIALLLAAMTLLTFLQVVLRYLFNTGLVWALEATTYLFAWMVLIGISYGIRAGAHIGIDFVVKALPRLPRRIAGAVAIGLCLVYAGLMTYGSYNYIDRMVMLGVDAEDIPLPRWLLGIILPIGFALLCVRLLQAAWELLQGRRDGLPLAHEQDDLLRDESLVGSSDLADREP
jgi:C4-dicarboxylate transporter DctQ subunit